MKRLYDALVTYVYARAHAAMLARPGEVHVAQMTVHVTQPDPQETAADVSRRLARQFAAALRNTGKPA